MNKETIRSVLSKSPWSVAKDVQLFIKSINQKKDIHTYLKNHSILKLQIGAGENYIDGQLNTDVYYSDKRIVFLNATKPFPMKDNTFNYIYSEHFIEHIPPDEGIKVLSESYRILKPNGKIRIACPNFDFLIDICSEEKSLIQKEYLAWSQKNIFNSEKIFNHNILVNKYLRNWGHEFIYDFETLKAYLEIVGFRNVIQCKVNESTDENFQGIERHFGFIPMELYKLETMILEAEKI